MAEPGFRIADPLCGEALNTGHWWLRLPPTSPMSSDTGAHLALNHTKNCLKIITIIYKGARSWHKPLLFRTQSTLGRIICIDLTT